MSTVLAALVGAMQMLAGAPEIILFTWAIAVPVTWLEGKRQKAKGKSEGSGSLRTFAFLLFTFALSFLLSAAQLLPFLDLVLHSHRSAAFDAGHDTMPLSGWANFLTPLFRMTPDRNGVFTHLDQQWTSSYYPGIGVLALAALAVWRRREPRVWLLALIAVLGVWLAMGQKAFLLDWLKAVCPPLGFIRFPIKYVLLPLIVLPFLAAFGVALLRQPTHPTEPLAKNPNDEPSRRWPQPLTVVVGTILAMFGGIHFWASRLKVSGLGSGISPQGPWAVVALITLATLLVRAPKAAWIVRCKPELVILFVLVADVLLHAPRQNPTVITHAYEPGIAPLSTSMPRLGEGRALITRETEGFMAHASNPDALNYVIGVRRALFANWNFLEGVPKANGFFSLFPRELSETSRLLYSFGHPFPERFADFLGLTRASSSDALFTWDHRTNALPLITAGQQPVFANATNTLRALAAADFNPTQVVYLPAALTAKLPVTKAASARVLSTNWTAHRIECEVESPAPTLVVIAQTFYHPWKATVNGQPTEILRANHAFQAVPIPAGRSVVLLEYVDRSFQLGLALSALGVILCGILWWRVKPNAELITNH